jgi:predicted GH43/DUF377 family glycosyl hydrolase
MTIIISKDLTKRIKELKGKRKNITKDIFERILYIEPEHIYVENYTRKKPISIFNPGALVRNTTIEIFPRLVFEYHWYVSSIGKFEIDVKKIKRGVIEKPILTKIILFPRENWELKGVEDPRVIKISNIYFILYTAVEQINGKIRPLQALAVMDEKYSITRKFFFKILQNTEFKIPNSWKDSAFLEIYEKSKALLLTRPSFNSLEICWACELDLIEGIVEFNSLRPVLVNEEFEIKVGWSTNVLKISSNEYLIGWHGVGIDMKYRNGLAILDQNGELKGISNYLLEPKGLIESYGDRPFVIFGCGLIKASDELYWIGGISDYMIGIFRTDLDMIFENIRWLNKK